MKDGAVNRATTSNENKEDNLRPCWTMNQSFVIFHIFIFLPNDKIMLKCKKDPQDVSSLVFFFSTLHV